MQKFEFWVSVGRGYIFFEEKYITPGACGLLPEFLLSYLHLLSYVLETVTFLQIFIRFRSSIGQSLGQLIK